MSDGKDPAIKLFGKTIQLPDDGAAATSDRSVSSSESYEAESKEAVEERQSDKAEKIATLVAAANVTIDSYWPGLFAKLCEKKSLDDLIMNVGAGGGGAAVAVSAPAAGGAAAAEEPAAAEKKEEAKEESDDDMGFSLFD